MLLNIDEVLPEAFTQQEMLNIADSDNINAQEQRSFFSLDPSISPQITFIIKPVVRNNGERDFSWKNQPSKCPLNDDFQIKSRETQKRNLNEEMMTSNKSKVPDILLINKYYGLIPQKFTITSRNISKNPIDAVSSFSRRNSSANASSRPRAKSSSHPISHNRHNGNCRDGRKKGSLSDSESTDSSNAILPSRHGPPKDTEDTSKDPFGPVTKKMAVERYKKWRCALSGGKGRNMVVRSSSDIEKSLSLLDNGLPGSFTSHARQNNNRATIAGELSTNRRVIRIDLNKVSAWDDENYGITTTPRIDSNISDDSSENKEEQVQPPLSTPTLSSFTCESQYTSTQSYKSASSWRDNNSNDYSTSSSGYCGNINIQGESRIIDTSFFDSKESDATTFVSTTYSEQNLSINESREKGFENIVTSNKDKETDTLMCVLDSTLVAMPTVRDMSPSGEKKVHESQTELLLTNARSNEARENNVNEGNNKVDVCLLSSKDEQHNITSITLGNDKKLASMQRNGKLTSTTLSFDDKILENVDAEGNTAQRRIDGDYSSKKRPITAAGRVNSCKSFPTPNSFNPPSRIVPWTQQKSTGGKALTLAERRAKFQRVSSIHSSSSLSMDTGEDEIFSEVESNTSQGHQPARPPSSAFRESRKPLHVTHPPEISTMVSQINPNADEDIQIEIEKVALMLKKMTSATQFSISLDSGIEAENSRASCSLETISSPAPNVVCAVENSVSCIRKNEKTSNYANSLNSPSSSSDSHDSESSDEEEFFSKEAKKSTLKDVQDATGRIATCVSDTIVRKNNNERTQFSSTGGIKQKTVLSQNNINIQHCKSNDISGEAPKRNPSLSTTRARTSSVSTLTNAESRTHGTGLNRPVLRKAVSISCEKELLKPDVAHKRNEVNLNTNVNEKSGRPKTANVTNSHHQRINVSGTRSINNNNYHRRQNGLSLSSGESHQTNFTSTSSSGGSQGSRNRKILIKKALMEVSQSSVNNARNKLGNLARPRTAPSNNNVTNPSHHSRKPLKASPFPMSSSGKTEKLSSGNSVSRGSGKCTEDVSATLNKAMEKGNTTGHVQRSNSEAPFEGTSDGTNASSSQEQIEQPRGESSKTKGRVFRQCISLDENALLGFSIKSVNSGRIPIFDKLAGSESTESCPNSIMDDEISFLSSKKREQCLKVYEKMVRTGCSIKLETVFRGMLTPSEYRAFIRAAERANDEAEGDNVGVDMEDDIDSNSNDAAVG